jgi:16S rRNA (uracil1498-N3)-methyltransferase
MNQALRLSSAHVFVGDIAAPVLQPDDVAHLSKSLRLRDGETVSVSDGNGQWRTCVWRQSEVVEPIGDVVTESRRVPECAVALTVVKGDRTDLAVEKLTEIGIDHIMLLAPLRRSVVRWDDKKFASNIERLSRIARGASMQSRRVFLPRITGPHSLSDVLSLPHSAIADPEGTSDVSSVSTIVIGPEGGFDPDELVPESPRVSLGQNILRAETAAIVAATLMVAHRARRSDHTG